MIRRAAALLLALLLPLSALAQGSVVNLIDHPDAAYRFSEDTPLLEVVFPAIHGSDCCILRMAGETMMVDASTDDQHPLVAQALQAMGVTAVDTAFATHPHDDHLTGFEYLPPEVSIGRLLIAFPEDCNRVAKRTMRRMAELDVPVEHVADGDVLRLGGAELTVVQRTGGEFTENDLSAMLMVRYGARTLYLAGDIENRGQAALIAHPPACGLKTDILKYPHHGHEKVRDPLWRLWNPELAVVTAHPFPAKKGFDYLRRMGVPGLTTWERMLRLRTDGIIWVVDTLPDGGRI